MLEYIYFVKCPNCEDEPFHFFDAAKEFALGCLSKKPIITQIEVDRNDFGECVDSCDLGTIWSWENMMQDIATNDESTKCVFTKDDLKQHTDDPEFQDDDFFAINNSEESVDPLDELFDANISLGIDGGDNNNVRVLSSYNPKEVDEMDLDELFDANISLGLDGGTGNTVSVLSSYDAENDDKEKLDELFDANVSLGISGGTGNNVSVLSPPGLGGLGETCSKKPIPDGMTIEELVEAMEENEDEVECTWCEDLFEKSECRYEVNLGWLCDRCQAAIMSRGEPLTFRENSYWDFLDEDAASKEPTWTCIFDDHEIGTVTAKTEAEALEKMQQEYPEYPYGLYDGCFDVFPEEDDILTEAHEFNNFNKLEPNELAKAKSDILLDLYCDADAGDFVNLSTESLSVPFIVDSYSPVTNKKNGTKCVGTIENFNIVGNQVIFKLESGMELSLQDIFTAASKDSKTRKFLDAFEFIVKKINKASRVLPSVLFERDLVRTLEKNPIFAETFAKYITDITFTVPLINVSPYDADFYNVVFADEVALDSDEGNAARKHIENLCNKFMSKPYATSAIEKNKVINRTVKNSDKSYHVNPKSWGNSSNITLSCSIKTLEAEAPGIKDLINNSKTIKDNSTARDVQDDDTTIKNFNLASALIQYFDNDVEFYKKPRVRLAASLTHDKKVSELTESSSSINDIVELEYEDFDDSYGPNTYTYKVDRIKVIEYLIDYKLDRLSDEELKTLLKLIKAPEEYSEEEYFQAIDDNFDEVFKKFEDDIYDHFREDCEEEYYSHDWEEIAYEQAMEFQWECDNDK